MTAPTSGFERRGQVKKGITWAVVAQVLDVVLSFASMLVLVRIIPASEYGRAAAAVGIYAFVNTFGSHVFVNHAIQLPEGETPDWQSHWSVAVYLQLVLFALCHAIAFACALAPQYRPLAPLLHVAAFGLLIDGPNQIGGAVLRREFDFRRVQMLAIVATALKLSVTMVLALAGKGAYAIVIGGNVMTAVPYGVYLLVVRRWQPPVSWWRPPSLARYRMSAQFGFQQIGVTLVSATTTAIESAVLPGAIGFFPMGLLSRARALYSTTAGRIGTVLLETVYPFLPRSAGDPERYRSHATTFLQTVLFVAIPAGTFLGLEGPQLSRLLYGQKWIAMDPLIWPGALSGIAMTVFMTAAAIVLATGALRLSTMLEIAMAALSVVALAVAQWTGAVVWYGWALTAAELVAAGVALGAISPLLQPHWLERTVLPAIGVTVAATAAVVMIRPSFESAAIAWRLSTTAAVFTCVAAATCRFVFPGAFSSLVHLAMGGRPAPLWLTGRPVPST